VDENGWGLLDAWEIETKDFMASKLLTHFVPLRQDMRSFLKADVADRSDLPLWHLSQVIDELRESGSNVERLRTAWHGKLSYAFSIVTMALLALALCSFFENMYVNLVISLLVIFSYYGLYVLGITTGQKGLVPPILAAWMANLTFSTLAGLRLAWICAPRFTARVHRWREGMSRRLHRAEG